MLNKSLNNKAGNSNKRPFILQWLIENSGLLIGLFALLLVVGVATGGSFVSFANIINLLRVVSLDSLVAFGMTFCIIAGGIDLSVGSIMAVSSTYCAGMVVLGLGFFPSIIIGILMGVILGAINGALIANTEIPPFIVTLSMMTAGRGVAYLYSEGKPIRTPNDFGNIGNGYLFDTIPYPVIIMIILMILLVILLSKTKFGRSVYAIGGNSEAARFTGINIRKITWLVYTLSGTMAGIAGVIWASRTYSGQPTLGNGAELDAIAAAIVGGTSMSGGVGKIGSTFIGALIIVTLNSGLNFLNVPFYYQNILQGVVIVLAVYVDLRRKKMKL